MSEEYRLEVECSSNKAISTLDKLAAQLRQLETSGIRASDSVNRVGNRANFVSSSFNILNRTSNNAGEGVLRLRKNSDDLNSSLLLLGKSVVSYELAARAISAADTYNNIQNRLKLVTENQMQLNIALKDTFDISQATGTVWESTVQVYQRFLAAAKDVGKTQAEIGSITETVSKSVAMSGATAESANAALVQFSQGIASGVLRGQEFNSVAEQTPALLDAIARGLNVNRGQLRQMANDGKLTTAVLLNALENSKESTDALFSRMNMGVSATFNKLKNATVQWVGELDKASGTTMVLTGALNMLAENLDGAAFLVGAAAVAYLTKTMLTSALAVRAKMVEDSAARVVTIAQIQAISAETAATAANTQVKIANATAQVAEAQAMVKNATSATALLKAKTLLSQREAVLAGATAAGTAATTANTVATNALATATSRLNMVRTAASGLLGGPVGMIALGVGAISMLGLLSRSTDESAEAAERHAKYIGLTNEQLKKMSDIQKGSAVDTLTESLKVQNKELELMESRFQAVVNDIITGMAKMGNSSDLDQAREVQRLLLTDMISYEEALDRLNKLAYVTKEQKQDLIDAETNYNKVWRIATDVVTALKQFGKEAEVAGDKAQNSALKQNSLADSLGETKEKAEEATKALREFRKSQLESIMEDAYTVRRAKDTSLDQAKEEGKLYAKTGRVPTVADQDLIRTKLKYKDEADALEDAEKGKEKRKKKAAADAKKEQERLNREATKDYEKKQKEYERYIDDLASEPDKVVKEYTKILNLFAEFGNEDPKVLEKITMNLNEDLARAQIELRNYKDQWADYYNTDMDNVDKKYKQEEMLLRFNSRLTKEEREQSRKDLMSAWENERDNIQLQEEFKRLEAEKTFMTEKAYIEELLKLQLKQIELTPNLTPQQKNTRMNIVGSEAQNQVNQIDQTNLNNYIDSMKNAGLGGGPQSELQQKLDETREIVNNAYEQGIIDKQTQLDTLSRLDQNYWQTSAEMWTNTWSSSLDGWSSFFSSVLGENSSAFKAIFALQKSFAIAAAALNIQKAISDGWATGATVYDKVAAVATIISSTGEIMSNLSQITMKGYKDGGYTGSVGKNTVAGVVHGNEFVMPAEQTAKYRGALESMRDGSYDNGSSGAPSMVNYFTTTITVTGDGASASTNQNDMGQLGKALEQSMLALIQKESEPGGYLYKQFNKA